MADREKVINGLECCLHDEDDDHGRLCEKCPYDCGDCRKDLYNDVLGLLKEQEPLKPYIDSFNDSCWWATGCCGTPINLKTDKFCPKCGRKVKWDG